MWTRAGQSRIVERQDNRQSGMVMRDSVVHYNEMYEDDQVRDPYARLREWV